MLDFSKMSEDEYASYVAAAAAVIAHRAGKGQPEREGIDISGDELHEFFAGLSPRQWKLLKKMAKDMRPTMSRDRIH
jgi:hypothetical protein